MQLAPREVHADAAMWSEGERLMLRPAIETNLVGIFVFLLVATGERRVHDDTIARHYANAGNLGLVHANPEGRHCRVGAQQLLCGERNLLGTFPQINLVSVSLTNVTPTVGNEVTR